MHDFLNVLQYKLDTKPIQKFCIHFQRFSLFSLDNTRSLQKFAILYKTFVSCFKISQKQCKIFEFCLKMFVSKCKKVVKDGIIWIISKQTVKNFLVEERFWKTCHLINFNLGNRSKTRKNQVQTNSDFQRNHKVSCLFVNHFLLSFLLVLKNFLWHTTVGFRLFLRDFG